MERLPEGALLVMLSGEPAAGRGDEFFPFAPKRNFYYITGIDKPFAALTAFKSGGAGSGGAGDKIEETLFVRPPDPDKARWTDDFIDADDARAVSGIADIKPLPQLEERLSGYLFGRAGRVCLDLENRSLGARTDETLLAARIKDAYPAIEIADIYREFAALRRIKQPREVERIRSAVSATAEALGLILRGLRPGMMEYGAEALFDFAVRRRGMRPAFPPICASGPSAAILHYASNSRRMSDGELLLLDIGAADGWYSADISRTYPVGGRFTERQRQLYDIVLSGQKAVIDAIKPGVEFKALNETLLAHYARELRRIGLIESPDEVKRYYYHGVSHMLGLETHDIGRGSEGTLAPGMVLTVEPGLYILEEGVGIRIEDDVLVTETGAEILSAAIPREPDEIERLMADGVRRIGDVRAC